MIETLITSKTRVKLLLKFFLNSNTKSYLRNLESEFGDSTNAIRQELNRLEGAGLLSSEKKGNKKLFQANMLHPLFGDLQNIIKKFVGIDQIIERIVERVGNVDRVYLEGELARGIDSDVVDLVLIGETINRAYLTSLIEKIEPILGKHIRYVIKNKEEATKYLVTKNESFLIWNKSC